MPEPKPGFCRCGKKDEDCPICSSCASPHASCLPCKQKRSPGGAGPGQGEELASGEFRSATDACKCRHLAGVHSLAGPCLVAKIDSTGAKKLQPPGPTPAGITRCDCASFSPLVARAAPPPSPAAEDDVVEDEPEEEVDEDEGVDVVA